MLDELHRPNFIPRVGTFKAPPGGALFFVRMQEGGMIRAVLIVGMVAAASPTAAKEFQALAGDLVKGCEAASTYGAYINGNAEGLSEPLKRTADQCVQVAQALISEGAQNGICPQKLPVANMHAAASVVFYLFNAPADLIQPFPEVAKKALQGSFPCK
jgi:hypothetical protein